MDEQVKNISEVIQSLQTNMQSMRATIDSQHTQICRQARIIEKLSKENKELRKRLSKYALLRTVPIAARLLVKSR